MLWRISGILFIWVSSLCLHVNWAQHNPSLRLYYSVISGFLVDSLYWLHLSFSKKFPTVTLFA